MKHIIKFLDDYLVRTGKASLDPVEANALLAKAGLLTDSKDRPGKPLRNLLRKGKLPHASQSGGSGSSWIIPHSANRKRGSNYSASVKPSDKKTVLAIKPKASANVEITGLKKQLEDARLKYKPSIVKYLLIAEAPPDSIDRFFYYENVHQHDYLFLGVAEALYPELKENFLASGRNNEIKNSILLKLKADGFYLIDLSELPLSLMDGYLYSQLPSLVQKINQVVIKQTKIILIKATIYDITYLYLQREGFEVVDIRIHFPGQGGQKKFQDGFKQALKIAGYY